MLSSSPISEFFLWCTGARITVLGFIGVFFVDKSALLSAISNRRLLTFVDCVCEVTGVVGDIGCTGGMALCLRVFIFFPIEDLNEPSETTGLLPAPATASCTDPVLILSVQISLLLGGTQKEVDSLDRRTVAVPFEEVV